MAEPGDVKTAEKIYRIFTTTQFDAGRAAKDGSECKIGSGSRRNDWKKYDGIFLLKIRIPRSFLIGAQKEVDYGIG